MSGSEIDSVVTVKLGGSLITDKTGDAMLRRDVLERLAHELAVSHDRLSMQGVGLIVGHGSGSFGHVAAQKVGYDRKSTEGRTREAASQIQAAALELHRHVMRALGEAGLACFSLQPSSFLLSPGASIGLVSPEALAPLERALRQRLVPVVFGDVILDEKSVFSIASTERVLTCIVEGLSSSLPVTEVLWLGETDGILDQEGKTVSVLDRERLASATGAVGGARGSDVTGGMAHRLETVLELSRLGTASRILNGLEAGALENALAGREAGGTRIEAHFYASKSGVTGG